MITVYAIKSKANNDIYVGIAQDPDLRLKQHNAGKSKYTKGFRPWVSIYKEVQPDWKSARNREKILKSGFGKEFLRSLAP